MDQDWQLLVIGAVATADESGVMSLDSVESADDVCGEIRVDMAVIVGQLECMSKDDGAHLLSRLRDLISQRVLLVLNGDNWPSDELLALGYMQIRPQKKRSSEDERLFLYDPDQFNEPRIWNNTTNWANPENFNKYRW